MTKPKSRELCFDPNTLHDENFDVQKFLASVRTKAPLSVLRDDLRTNLDDIQAELVTCVQKDFQTFVSLGQAISEVENLAKVTSEPLDSLKAELRSLVESLDNQISELDSTLSRRTANAQRKAALEVLIRVHDLLQKCERLLKGYSKLPAHSSEALRLAERLANECAQLSFALSRAGNGNFIRSVSVRISTVKRSVRNCLDGWLRRTLFPPGNVADDSVYDNDILARVLSMHVVAGLTKEAEELFRREIVAPFTADRLRMTPMLAVAEKKKSREKPSSPTNSQRTGMPSSISSSSLSVTAADALEAAEEEIINFLGSRVTPIVSLCETDERLRTHLDFVGNSVWPQIEKAIGTHMAAAFSPSIPNVFHKSVLSGTRLYAAIEAAAGTEEQREHLRNSTSTVNFWKRWNFSVYFQLRFVEIATAFDECLRAGPVPSSDSSTIIGQIPSHFSGFLRSDMYKVQATSALVTGLRRCWAEDVFLDTLTHRFVRLSLQLLARYMTWVRSGLAGEWSASSAVPEGAALVYTDVMLLQKRVPAELASVQRKRSSKLSQEILEELDAVFSDAVQSFSDLLPDLSRSISDSLAQSCMKNLKALRGSLATYHMSSKPAPTTYSQFVLTILKPLRAFLQAQGKLPSEEIHNIATNVVNQTTNEYYEMATELLSKNKNSEETLRRLNIGGNLAAGGGSSGISLTDKVNKQLCLDVDKYMDEIKNVGVNVENVPSAKLLAQCVSPKSTETLPEAPMRGDPTTVGDTNSLPKIE